MGTVTILGNTYSTIIMPDGKEWITENLKYEGSGLWRDGATSNDGCGRYYTSADMQSLLLSNGWRAPSPAEWAALRTSVSNSASAIKESGTTYWTAAKGSNTTGFALRGSGLYYGTGWEEYRDFSYAWSSTIVGSTATVFAVGSLETTNIVDYNYQLAITPTSRLPVRLVRDVTKANILGSEYRTVVMPDGKEWMAENLRYTGVSYLSPNGSSANIPTLGCLYKITDIYSVKFANGWRLPTFAELTNLVNSCGGVDVAGGRLKSIGTTYFSTPNTNANNEYDFDLRGAGSWFNGNYSEYLQYANVWADLQSDGLGRGLSTAYNHDNAGLFELNSATTAIVYYSVRLVRDINVVTILGDTYSTVVMPDGKEWINTNLRYNALGSWYDGVVDESTGKLYTRSEATNLSSLLSDGWRLPSVAEWLELYESIQPAGPSYTTAGGALKSKSLAHWQSPNTGSTDEYEFKLVGGGSSPAPGSYHQKGQYAYIWADSGYNIAFFSYNGAGAFAGSWSSIESAALSIRLVRDVAPKTSKVYVSHSNIWKPVKEIWVSSGGVWKKVNTVLVANGGVWS